MPGKGVRPPPGSGFNKDAKRRMVKREYEKTEWTFVAEKGELGENIGDTLAVEAGQSPQGVNYIWTLIRGEEGAGAIDEDSFSNVYATDGSCRACTFPMTKATVETAASSTVNTATLGCPACGAEFSLLDGSVIKWLPGEGPMQFVTKQLNKNKEPIAAGILPTRVSKSGRIYVRLPDGTLPIAKTAADRADELAGSVSDGLAGAQLSAKELVKAAQARAAKGAE
jgi:nitrite reductase/ring-hydroxylating ferredoxin subunit